MRLIDRLDNKIIAEKKQNVLFLHIYHFSRIQRPNSTLNGYNNYRAPKATQIICEYKTGANSYEDKLKIRIIRVAEKRFIFFNIKYNYKQIG